MTFTIGQPEKWDLLPTGRTITEYTQWKGEGFFAFFVAWCILWACGIRATYAAAPIHAIRAACPM
jgi:hypothetical protein